MAPGGVLGLLLDALESWPAAPHGEFFARAWLRRSLSFRLAIAEGASRADRLRWIDDTGWVTWPSGVCGEHLHLSEIPLASDPRIEEVLLRRVHLDLPGDAAWEDVEIGELASLLTDPGRAYEARQVSLDDQQCHSDPRYRDEFMRIWTSLKLGHRMERAAERIFAI